jgi:quercetin dioxygenase-like cupin family protein
MGVSNAWRHRKVGGFISVGGHIVCDSSPSQHAAAGSTHHSSSRATKPHPRKNITMKRIPTSKPVGLPRFTYAIIVCALIVSTIGMGSGIAADKNAKSTLVYEHALPNVPGKSIKGVLVEYGPGGTSPAHTHPKSAFIYATVLEGAIRSSVNDGPVVTYRTGQSFSEMPGDRHSVSENASTTEPAKLLAVFVVNTDEKELTTPYEK